MISKKLLIFFLLFLVIEYLLLITEWYPYLDMYSDIQGYKFNWFKSQDNKLKLIPLLIHSFFFLVLLFVLSRFLGEKIFKINLVSFLFIVLIYGMWDFAYYIIFEKALKHLPVLLYDMIVVGGLCLVLTQFIFNKFYKILEKNIPILVLLYFINMFLFFYVCYKYNPDVSNITGISQPYHVLFIIFISLASIFCYNLLKFK